MNEQLQQVVSALIAKSISVFETGATFMAAEIPDVVHQLMLWYAVKSVIFCISGVVILIVGLISDYRVFVLAKKDPDIQTPIVVWGIIGCIPRILVYGGAFTLMNLTWLHIWIAPKIWLIEYAAKLVTK